MRSTAEIQRIVLFGGLTLAGAGFAVSAVGYGVMLPESRVGPGFLPLVAGCLLAVLSALLLREQLLRPEAVEEPGTDDFGRGPRERVLILRRVFGLLLAALLLMPVLGMVLAFALLVLAVSVWLEGRSWPQALLMSAVCAVALYGVFAVLLGVPLPVGVLGF